MAEDGGGHGQFTQVGRFVALQDAALGLIDELVARHRVERTEGTDLDPFASEEWPGARSVRLAPPDGAAPLAFVFGDDRFPGVDLHPGHGGRFLLPGCFCDACDEDVDETIDHMRWLVDAVTAGRFSEGRAAHVIGPDTYHEVIWGDLEVDRGTYGQRIRTDRLPAGLEASMPRGQIDWAPWSPTTERVVEEARAAVREMAWDRGDDPQAFRGEDVRLDDDSVVVLVRRSADDRVIGARFPAPRLPQAGFTYTDILMRTTHDWIDDLRILLMEQLGTGADGRPPRAEHEGWTEIDLWIDPFAPEPVESIGDWRYRPPAPTDATTRRWGREQPWWRW